jgi:hypothetical protein
MRNKVTKKPARAIALRYEKIAVSEKEAHGVWKTKQQPAWSSILKGERIPVPGTPGRTFF